MKLPALNFFVAGTSVQSSQGGTCSYRWIDNPKLGPIMAHWTYDIALMQFLVDHRTVLLTKMFLFASFWGETNAYILVVTLIYVMFDKTLAVRLSVVVLLTMCFNHVLKIIIKNPRPFIRENTYLQKWAVSTENAKELAMEFSTPSGHAMGGSAFYSYLYASVENRFVQSRRGRCDSSHRTLAPLPRCPLSG